MFALTLMLWLIDALLAVALAGAAAIVWEFLRQRRG